MTVGPARIAVVVIVVMIVIGILEAVLTHPV